MIESVEELADLFSILHDGVIVEAVVENRDLTLRVEIRYLTQRIRSDFTTFVVRLAGVEDLAFTTWPNDASLLPQLLRDASEIFVPALDILSGELKEGLIHVACNQPSPKAPYCGGTLAFRAKSAEVSDELGKRYSHSELVELARGYWDEWKRGNERA